MMNNDTIPRSPWCRVCFWILLAELLFAVPGYYLMLNTFGPSTLYLDPTLPTAVTTGPDRKPTVYLGDEFYVAHMTIRFERNGNCLLKIHRYAEHVTGPTPGKRHLIDYAELQFVGANDIMRPRWPPFDNPYILSYERDEQGHYLDGSLIVDANGNPVLDANGEKQYRSHRPIMPDGVDELEMDFYVTPRNFCNLWDYVFPRYTAVPRIRALVKRHKPSTPGGIP